MVKEEFVDDLLKEAFNTMQAGPKLETTACRFITRCECNHVGDEDGIQGCIAFLLGKLLKRLERW